MKSPVKNNIKKRIKPGSKAPKTSVPMPRPVRRR